MISGFGTGLNSNASKTPMHTRHTKRINRFFVVLFTGFLIEVLLSASKPLIHEPLPRVPDDK